MKPNHEYGTYPSSSELRFVRILPGPIGRVWEYLTVPEKRGLWLARGTSCSEPGGKMKLEFYNTQLTPQPEPVPDQYKEHAKDGCGFEATILRFEPPHVLSHTFGEDDGTMSEVTYELTELGDQVQLVLTHIKAPDKATLLSISAGWHTHLTVLLAKLEGRTPPPFWGTLMELKAEYAGRIDQLEAVGEVAHQS
jgi:uncharacterized protein YndB with AHSA1/START domain